MSDFCDMPYVVRKGIFDLIRCSTDEGAGDLGDSKKMNAKEAAIAFLSDELEGLFERYECLNSTPPKVFK